MGDLRSGGGGPPEDASRPLPDFPPEWGPIVIPDNAAELDGEAAALRRELRRHGRRGVVRSLLGIRARRDLDQSSLGVPAVIMAVAVLVTLISLFVATWGRGSSPHPPTDSATAAAPAPVTTSPKAIGELVLPDATGTAVRIGSLAPAVLILVDDCDCAALLADITAAVPDGFAVVPVSRTAARPATPANRPLADPDGLLRSRLPPTTTGAASAIVLDRTGAVVATIPTLTSVRDLPASAVVQ